LPKGTIQAYRRGKRGLARDESVDAHGNLPGELTGFVGRRAELALVRQSLIAARLVTLTGPGGIGKTRLAQRAATAARRAFRDGVWLTELAGLRDPALLAAELARSLGLSDQAAPWGVAALTDYLAVRQALLILDGCEHLTDGCAVLADALLRGCPELRILATSRHVLRVAGEITIAVPPMTVPDEAVPGEAGSGAPGVPGDLSQYEAVRLFAERAAAVLPEFVIDDGNGPVVAALCRRLDGIPLAIELAAGRLRSLSPGQILARLDSGFELLSGGGPARPPRHRALEATLEWSYGLLTDAEQAVWRRVSVFAGSFDLDAAEYVCAGDSVISPQSVADLIDGLVAKSILLRTAGQDAAAARYRLLDTIGAFGLRKLRAEGDEPAFRLRHFDWYAALAARQGAWRAGRARWLADVDSEHENLRAALEFSLSPSASPGLAADGTGMACDLWGYWQTHGHLTEGRRILAAALELPGQPARIRCRALWIAGYLAGVQVDLPAARTLLEAAIETARSVPDAPVRAYASAYLAYVLFSTGETAAHGALFDTALTLHRESADPVGIAMTLLFDGFIRLVSGEPGEAARRFAECAERCEHDGLVYFLGHARWGLAVAAWLLSDYARASDLAVAGLRLAGEIEDRINTAQCLEALGWIAVARQGASRALILLAAAEMVRATISVRMPPALDEYHAAALRAAAELMPEPAVAAALARGAAMTPAEAVRFGLGEAAPSGPAPPGPHCASSLLTRRELDVAALVAQGLSNSQIAAALVISSRTAETHVAHIMTKLGFSARSQIAAWSAASGQRANGEST
jgi:predicted ATPase/DNA-binding NarL/FixJ family response regulator